MKRSPSSNGARLLEAERQLGIINILQRNKTVQITMLSRMLGVSPNTIRRDLKKLEGNGVLRRTHGGAIANDSFKAETAFETREDERRDEKSRIGLSAAQMIQDGETVIIDSGTTTMHIARNLSGKRSVIVITNSIRVANEFTDNERVQVIVTGGILRPLNRCLIGFWAEQFLEQFHVDKTFLSAGGIDLEAGLTDPNAFEIQVKNNIIRAGKEVILVADSSKFGKVELVPICPLSSVHKIITDSGIPPRYVSALSEMEIKLITV